MTKRESAYVRIPFFHLIIPIYKYNFLSSVRDVEDHKFDLY